MRVRTTLVAVALGALSLATVAPALADVVDPAPLRVVNGAGSSGSLYGAALADDGHLYTLRYTNGVVVYGPEATGDDEPVRHVFGDQTGLSAPGGPYGDDLKLGPDGVYTFVSSGSGAAIVVHRFDADGNVPPLRRISGPSTGLSDGVSFHVAGDGTVYVGTYSGKVLVFAPGAKDDVAPVATIEGTQTGLSVANAVGTDALGFLYVADTDAGDVKVFAPGADGDVEPLRVFRYGLNIGDTRIAVDSTGRVYVPDPYDDAVRIFAPGASGDAEPVRTVQGSSTGIDSPWPITLRRDRTMVVGNDGGSVAVHGPQLLDPPSAPRDLVVGGKADDALRTVSWTAPLDDGGLPIGYEVTMRRDGRSVAFARTSDTQVRWEGRTFRGGTSTVTVTAVNSRGRTATSTTVTVSALRPTKVRTLKVKGKKTAAKRTVRWKKPVWDGGAVVDRYRVVVKAGKRVVLRKDVKKTKVRLKAKKLGTGKRKVVVRAGNSKGFGPPVKKRFRVA